jgi:hypothetical protein
MIICGESYSFSHISFSLFLAKHFNSYNYNRAHQTFSSIAIQSKMGNCTSTRSVVSSPEQESTSRIVTTTSGSKPAHEELKGQQKRKIEKTNGSRIPIVANQLLPFDEVSHESSDTHRITLNGGSFDYEDIKVVFYEVSH